MFVIDFKKFGWDLLCELQELFKKVKRVERVKTKLTHAPGGIRTRDLRLSSLSSFIKPSIPVATIEGSAQVVRRSILAELRGLSISYF